MQSKDFWQIANFPPSSVSLQCRQKVWDRRQEFAFHEENFSKPPIRIPISEAQKFGRAINYGFLISGFPKGLIFTMLFQYCIARNTKWPPLTRPDHFILKIQRRVWAAASVWQVEIENRGRFDSTRAKKSTLCDKNSLFSRWFSKPHFLKIPLRSMPTLSVRYLATSYENWLPELIVARSFAQPALALLFPPLPMKFGSSWGGAFPVRRSRFCRYRTKLATAAKIAEAKSAFWLKQSLLKLFEARSKHQSGLFPANNSWRLLKH